VCALDNLGRSVIFVGEGGIREWNPKRGNLVVPNDDEELVKELQDIHRELTKMKISVNWYTVVLFLSTTALITWKCASSLM